MKGLLDTHAFLWWINDDPRLSANAREIIADSSLELLLSSASAWEIVIKSKLGRMKLPPRPDQFILEQMALNSIESLPINIVHALHVYHLPDHHRDPFDRLIIAQAQIEKIPIITSDGQIAKYRVEILW